MKFVDAGTTTFRGRLRTSVNGVEYRRVCNFLSNESGAHVALPTSTFCAHSTVNSSESWGGALELRIYLQHESAEMTF